MYRIFAALMVLLLLSGVSLLPPLFALPAAAETADMPALEAVFVAEPNVLSAPGSVVLTLTLTNNEPDELSGITLTAPDGLTVNEIGNLEPGASATLELTHNVSQAELNAGTITYAVSCESAEGRFSFPAKGHITYNIEVPQIEFVRRISSPYAASTQSTTLVYKVSNTGSVTVNDLKISDPLGNYEAELHELEPGESHAFVSTLSIQEDSISAPMLSYRTSASPENSYSVRLSEESIKLARGVLDVTLTAGRSMFAADTVEVILSLHNGGNVDYSNIIIYDDIYGGVIADSIQLPADSEELEIIHSYPIRGDSVYRWRVTGVNAAGETIDFITDTVEVYANDSTENLLLTLSASARTPQISRSGYVSFDLTLNNIGSGMISNVKLAENTLGPLGSLAVVPTGDPTVRTLRLEVRENTSFVFTAAYTDLHGQQRIATSQPIEVLIVPGGARPESADGTRTLYSGFSQQFEESPLYIVLLVCSVAVLILLIIVLLITSRRIRIQLRTRKQRAKKSSAAKRPTRKK